MDIAIIGMSGRFPQAANINSFYENLARGVDCVQPFPLHRLASTGIPPVEYIPGGYLDQIDRFDYPFFGISLDEAEKMDPNQRVLLEVAYAVFENARLTLEQVRGSKTSVYVTDKVSGYHKLFSQIDAVALMGNLKAAAAGRISRFFDLRGISLMVDSACSSSLVAVHLACQALELKHCVQALVFASEINAIPLDRSFEGLGTLSPSGTSKAFANGADGIGLGELAGGVLLKRLDDATRDGNTILAVIKGIAVNQDAALSASLTAPNSISQEQVLLEAWERAGISPTDIGFFEAHGTGTKIGDPIEIKAIQAAFSRFTDRCGFCALSSVKTNIGHTDGAAGMAGLIKTILSLQRKVLFPSLHFTEANELIDFPQAAVYVNTRFQPWAAPVGSPRTAAISAFSIMGTNAHAVLQEYIPEATGRLEAAEPLPGSESFLILLSARSATSLTRYKNQLLRFLQDHEAERLENISWTLSHRTVFPYRCAWVVKNNEELIQRLREREPVPPAGAKPFVVLALTGRAVFTQAEIAFFVARYTRFRMSYEALLKHAGDRDIQAPIFTSFAFQYCLADLLLHQGVTVDLYLLDRFGQLVSAALKGKYTLPEALENLATVPTASAFSPEKVGQFINILPGSERILVIDIAPTDELSQAFDAVAHDLDVVFVRSGMPVDDTTLYDFYATLYQQHVPLSWDRVPIQPGESCALPGYAFDPHRCWIRDVQYPVNNEWIYTLAWQEAPLVASIPEHAGLWVVFSDNDALYASLQQHFATPGKRLLRVAPGVATDLREDCATIRRDDEASCAAWVNYICAAEQNLRGIIFDDMPLDGNEEAVMTLLHREYTWARALEPLLRRKQIYLCRVTEDGFHVTGAERSAVRDGMASVHGFMFGLSAEYRGVRIKCLDVDRESRERLGEILALELGDEQAVSVAYRGMRRFFRTLHPQPLQEIIQADVVQENQTYVIVGGSDGIGLEVARWFSTMKPVTLILVGRRQLLPREQWDQYDSTHAHYILVTTLRAMEARGCTVAYYSLDVADGPSVETAFADVHDRFGPIAGVIYSAGLPGDVLLSRVGWDRFEEIIAAKASGVVNIAAALRHDSLSFFTLFSSVDSLAGSPGNTGYNAANMFLDNYIYTLHEKGINASVVNWTAWRETGMFERAHRASGHVALHALTTVEGLSMLHHILCRPGRHWVISKEDPRAFSGQMFVCAENMLVLPLSVPEPTQPDSVAEAAEPNSLQVVHWNDYQNKIGFIWKEILKLDSLALSDSFFDLGGHSLHGAQVMNRVEDQFGLAIEFDVLLDFPTLETFSEYIEDAVRKRMPAPPPASAIVVEVAPEYAASSAQTRMWLTCQDAGAAKAYHELDVFEWAGAFAQEYVTRAIRHVLERHSALRSTFGFRDGILWQQIHTVAEQPVLYKETHGTWPDEVEKQRLIRVEALRPFDLATGPLYRFTVVPVGLDRYMFIFVVHHIVCDEASERIFLHDFIQAYEALVRDAELPAMTIAHASKEYVRAEQLYLAEPHRHAADKTFWLTSLEPWSRTDMSDTHRPRAGQEPLARSLVTSLDRSVGDKLRTICSANGTTPFVVAYGVLSAFLSRFWNREFVVMATPVAERTNLALEREIGFFVNTLPLGIATAPDDTLEQVVAKAKAFVGQALRHQAYPYDAIVESLRAAYGQDLQAGIEAMILFRDEKPAHVSLAGAVLERVKIPLLYAKFPLVVHFVRRNDGGIDIAVTWNEALYDDAFGERISTRLASFLTTCLTQPARPLREHPWLPAGERKKVLTLFNQTDALVSSRGVLELIHGQVQQRPEATALVWGEQTLSFGELWQRSGYVGSFLHEQGVQPDALVAVMLERSLDMIVCILGILRSGAAYVPIDPQYPEDVAAYILRDSRARIVFGTRVPAGEARAVDPVKEWAAIAACPALPEGDPRTPTSLTYVIYTSGSTGRPKGAMIEDAGLVNRIDWMWKEYGFATDDVILQKTPFVFDVSVWEIFMPLCYGARLVLCAREVMHDPALIAAQIRRHGITTIHFVPSMYQVFLEWAAQHEQGMFTSLRRVIASGEALGSTTVGLHHAVLGIPLHNLYGPTEASVDVTHYTCRAEEDVVPIGKPIANIRIYVLTPDLEPVGIGEAGELCISGIGVARGYLNQPELTAAKFCRDPFDNSRRLYRTGDLAQWREDGHILYLGRKDDQVKIRGHRIEIGGMENILIELDGVLEAGIIVRDDLVGEKELVAYYSGKPYDGSMLRAWLLNRLVNAVVPNAFVWLDKLPRTASGKVDKVRLKKQAHADLQPMATTPVNNTQQQLYILWQEVLGAKSFGVYDNFLSLGGNSIKAVRVCSLILRDFGVSVSFTTFLENPTISQLGHLVEAQTRTAAEQAGPRMVTRVEAAVQYYPLSPGQQRLWVLDSIDTDKRGYIIHAAYTLTGILHRSALEQAVQTLMYRHESLRTHIEVVDGVPYQSIAPALSALGIIEYCDGSVQAILQQNATEAFDLQRGALLRAKVIRCAEDQHILSIAVHHIICDARSFEILIEDLVGGYNAARDGRAFPSNTGLQYREYTDWINRKLASHALAKEEAYWTSKFTGELPLVSLPYDAARTTQRTYAGGRITRRLPVGTGQALTAFSAAHHVTPFVVLLSAVKTFLHKYSGQTDLIVGVPVANRPTLAFHTTVGFFVNTLPIRSRLQAEQSFLANLQEVKASFLESFEHQQYPFDKIVNLLQQQRDLTRNPLFDVMVSLREQAAGEITGMQGLDVQMNDSADTVSQFDLNIECAPHGDTVAIDFLYATELFRADTITRMAENFVQWVDRVLGAPGQPLNTMSVLSSAEAGVIQTFHTRESCDGREAFVVRLFEACAHRQGDQAAVKVEGRSISYASLNGQANMLAMLLRTKYTAQPGTVVGLMMSPSEKMIVALLAIFKAGAIYLPLDPEIPVERRKTYIRDSDAVLTIADDLDASIVPGVLSFDLLLEEAFDYAADNPVLISEPDDVAYLMYTSGSTGQPKGALIRHIALTEYLYHSQRLMGTASDDKVVQLCSIAFDASLDEIFGCLCFGGTLLIARHGGRDIEGVLRLVESEEATILLPTPLILNELNKEYTRLRSVRCIGVGGDQLLPSHINNLLGRVTLYNLYGPTECTISVTAQKVVQAADTGTIGIPFPNVEVLILDADMNRVPIGVAGEIYLGGNCLARGYHGVSLDNKFQPHPFEPGARVFSTGDLGKWNAEGSIVFLGRKDHQVKIRGYRIELQEIEHVLRMYPAVQEAVVLEAVDGMGKQLVAFIVDAVGTSKEKMRFHLERHLPFYMIPSRFVFLEQLPININGKIDMLRLRVLATAAEEESRRRTAAQTFGSAEEMYISTLWREVLQNDQIGAHDNFFEVGGDSITLLKLLHKIESDYPGQVKVSQLFSHSTITAQAELLKHVKNSVEDF